MISRQWKGIAKSSEAQRYTDHLRNDTFPKLANIHGFIHATILQRTVPEGEEFLIVTVWQSLDAIRQFAGDNAETAVVPEVVQAMMVDYDKTVRHYAIVETRTIHP